MTREQKTDRTSQKKSLDCLKEQSSNGTIGGAKQRAVQGEERLALFSAGKAQSKDKIFYSRLNSLEIH